MIRTFYGSKTHKPPGRLVKVEAGYMHVFAQGSGGPTCVFLSGGGTCSPLLDFKPLWERFSQSHRIAVVEKFGYGFSDEIPCERDIGTILRQTRAALQAAGEKPPYLLLPHSMSGMEALYWAQQYPREIAGIIGLDMAVPETYKGYPVPSKLAVGLLRAVAKVGALRPLSFFYKQTPAMQCGHLNEAEQALYKTLFTSRTFTGPMVREIAAIPGWVDTMEASGVPQDIPLLLFASNGEGVGVSMEVWRGILREYAGKTALGEYMELDCGHYIHDYMPEEIAGHTRAFLARHGIG